MGDTMIYGRHSVDTALSRAPVCVREVFATDEALQDAKFAAKVARAKRVTPLDPKRLPEGVPAHAGHQGLVAAIDVEALFVSLDTALAGTPLTPKHSLMVLGEVQDPQNVGAIIRSAAAFGVAGVILPRHRQSPITGAVAKASAGAVFSVPLVSVTNVNSTLSRLKRAGYWVYGLSHEVSTTLYDESFTKPSVFVFGNEGDGIRKKTQEHCDQLLSIPIHPQAESLNVSVAAAVTLSTWRMQHRFKSSESMLS